MMKIIRSKTELELYIKNIQKENLSIGFAPTMGALHAGHLSLYESAHPENDIVISSIFVNPTQFNNREDFEKYPNTIDKDIELLEKSGLVNALYLPSVEDLYPNGTESKEYPLGELENVMEGKFRPGHFQGVATVVETLLLQVQPNKAYFGEKDYQQIAVIKKLVELQNLPVEIRTIPTMREKNGLAMSSRNLRLSTIGKENASIIYKTLLAVKEWVQKYSLPEIEEKIENIFDRESNMELEYFTIADAHTLTPTSEYIPLNEYRAFMVVHVEGVRLIDNIPI